MSQDPIRSLGREAADLLVDAAWRQWGELVPGVVPRDRRARTLIDPEALVLGSLAASDQERRLVDVVASWAREAAGFMSLQRMRQLASRFPARTRGRLGHFASAAVRGGDRRWRSLNEKDGSHGARPKALGEIRMLEGPALTLRLRAGFGVNAKADLLSFLLGIDREPADLTTIADATAYSQRTVRNAADEMALAGFILEIEGRPSSFYAIPERWTAVLAGDRADPRGFAIPPWRPWGAAFGFLSAVMAWAGEAEENDWTTYVARSRAQDLHEQHRRPLRLGRTEKGPPTVPEEGMAALHLLIERIGTWL